ncbi:MAG: hypothetical protein ACK5XZ_12775 [Hyphomonadaceae bacterium]|jgi:hypothetical protein|uniref:hypothetical protein n=1 Tax=Aquidulcibacter sp. TaxID=2052990 RepID=UPI0022CCA319|nr:hypothetical protein [Aquidulcibacter sp.]MCE2890593.1 hypothetical protein [Hyphomonadaceae bacterium]MCZ8206923.1 hypothetical protein [Aquidulcibacter sp.]
MFESPESPAPEKSSSFGRIFPILIALVATGGLIYWFVKPKPDIRYARAASVVMSQIEPGGKVLVKLERGAEVSVLLTKELNGWATIMVGPSDAGFIRLAEIDSDRRPVLTGAYKAKAVQKSISLRDEPNPTGLKVDDIPAKTMIQVWGYTETPTGNWAEITRYNEKGVGYVPREELEAAFE